MTDTILSFKKNLQNVYLAGYLGANESLRLDINRNNLTYNQSPYTKVESFESQKLAVEAFQQYKDKKLSFVVFITEMEDKDEMIIEFSENNGDIMEKLVSGKVSGDLKLKTAKPESHTKVLAQLLSDLQTIEKNRYKKSQQFSIGMYVLFGLGLITTLLFLVFLISKLTSSSKTVQISPSPPVASLITLPNNFANRK